jgi:hypothetical protein
MINGVVNMLHDLAAFACGPLGHGGIETCAFHATDTLDRLCKEPFKNLHVGTLKAAIERIFDKICEGTSRPSNSNHISLIAAAVFADKDRVGLYADEKFRNAVTSPHDVDSDLNDTFEFHRAVMLTVSLRGRFVWGKDHGAEGEFRSPNKWVRYLRYLNSKEDPGSDSWQIRESKPGDVKARKAFSVIVIKDTNHLRFTPHGMEHVRSILEGKLNHTVVIVDRDSLRRCVGGQRQWHGLAQMARDTLLKSF